jgi:hypothetical protein
MADTGDFICDNPMSKTVASGIMLLGGVAAPATGGASFIFAAGLVLFWTGYGWLACDDKKGSSSNSAAPSHCNISFWDDDPIYGYGFGRQPNGVPFLNEEATLLWLKNENPNYCDPDCEQLIMVGYNECGVPVPDCKWICGEESIGEPAYTGVAPDVTGYRCQPPSYRISAPGVIPEICHWPSTLPEDEGPEVYYHQDNTGYEQPLLVKDPNMSHKQYEYVGRPTRQVR